MNLEEFREKWGKQHYLWLQTPHAKALLATLKLNSPQTRMLHEPIEKVAQFGQLFTAQNQGFHDAVTAIESTLVVQPGGGGIPDEPTYTQDEQDQPAPRKPKRTRK